MKILIEEKDLDKLEVLLSETHRWIESDGFFEVQAHLTNMGFLEQWFGNSQLQIYLHTNYYYSLEEQQEEQNLGLPRKISLRGFFDWLDKSEFDGSIESFNNLFLGDISHIQISLGAKKNENTD